MGLLEVTVGRYREFEGSSRRGSDAFQRFSLSLRGVTMIFEGVLEVSSAFQGDSRVFLGITASFQGLQRCFRGF